MSLQGIVALLRRHILAVMAVLVLASGAGYDLKGSAPTYSESATVVFTVKAVLFRAFDHYSTFRNSLIATEVMMAQDLSSHDAEAQIRAMGGTAQFQLAPFNVYDMQYPDYAEPFGTLTAASTSPANVQRTMALALKYLASRLATVQAQAGVHPGNQIHIYLTGKVPPTKQPGSRTRVFAGLALLTVVAVFIVSNFLDRRRCRTSVRQPGYQYAGPAMARTVREL
jgi:hypothetical protein